MTCAAADRACCSSVLTEPKVRSGLASDAASYVGANWRHGPHQLAQKSTKSVSCSLMLCSKFSPVSSIVAMAPPYVTVNGSRRVTFCP